MLSGGGARGTALDSAARLRTSTRAVCKLCFPCTGQNPRLILHPLAAALVSSCFQTAGRSPCLATIFVLLFLRLHSPRALCSVASPPLPAPCFPTLRRHPSCPWQAVSLACQVMSPNLCRSTGRRGSGLDREQDGSICAWFDFWGGGGGLPFPLLQRPCRPLWISEGEFGLNCRFPSKSWERPGLLVTKRGPLSTGVCWRESPPAFLALLQELTSLT